MRVSPQEIKIFGRGNQKLFIPKDFSLLNYTESLMDWPKPPLSNMTETLGVKVVTFDSLDQIFWFFVGRLW